MGDGKSPGSAVTEAWRMWWRQLYLLVWRNVLMRWRGGSIRAGITIPVFHVVEVAWPIVLYVILAILKRQFPPEDILDSKYRAYALPSAGTLPFMQTLFCDLGTGEDKNTFTDMPAFPNATINGLYSVLDDVGSWNASWTELCDSVHELSGEVSCLQRIGDLADEDCYQGSSDTVPVVCYLNDPSEFGDYLRKNLSLSEQVTKGILGATVNTSGIPNFPFVGRFRRQSGSAGGVDLLSFLQGVTTNSSLLKSFFCPSNQLSGWIDFSNVSAEVVQREVCQLNNSQWLGLAQQLQKQTTSDCRPVEVAQSVSQVLNLQRLLSESDTMNLVDAFSGSEWSVEGDSGPEQDTACEDSLDPYIHYFCGSLRNESSGVLKSILKRSCYGDSYQQADRERHSNGNTSSTDSPQNSLKILYTPSSDLTLGVMQKANKTFDSVGQIIELAYEVANCTQFFLDNFPPDSSTLEGVRAVLNQLILSKEGGDVSAPGAIEVAPLFPNVSLDTLLSARDLLNVSNPSNLWSIMSTVHDVSTRISEGLSSFNWDIFMPVDTEEELVDLASDYQRQKELDISFVVAGVVFDSVDHGSTSFSKQSQIRIRTNFSFVMDTTQYKEDIWYPGPENDFWKQIYINGFFVFIQDMIERAMVEELVGHQVPSPGVYLQEMPYPCFKEDKFTISLLYVLPLAMLFAWVFPVAMTARAVVREKESRLKEFMKMMGVSEGSLRLSWFLHSMAVLLVSVVGITVLLKAVGVLPATHWFIIFLFLSVYAVVMLSYSFLMSAFFNNANLAACVASLLYFLVFFAHTTIVPNLSTMSPVLIGVCCLWAPLAFGLGATFLVQWELKQQGLLFSNINIPAIEDDQISFLVILIIIMIDAVLYFVVTWYIEGVYPGRYGVAKPWYFPFTSSYWCGKNSSAQWSRCSGKALATLQEDEQELVELDPKLEEGRDNCEEEPEGLPLGISIQNMSKNYFTGFLPTKRKKTVAVKDLSLNFYEGQITAFLGHNGAGKTTTMAVLTGLFEPSSGTARIYGKNIRTKMDQIRQSLGMCPQHNILMDNLTVEEHLLFYGQLKGLSRSEAKDQVLMWLSKVDLSEHAHKYSKHLSGGMKRKLSILLAFVGNSKTIILDEPTSGVDPFSRQQIWDFLLRHRDGRTVMLSTHHMDEAEILGDRIAIISKGSLLCCGSFEYLKHHFGGGHRLILVQSDRKQSVSSRTFTVTADVEKTPNEDPPDKAEPVESAKFTPLSIMELPPIDEKGESRLTTFIQTIVTGASMIERRGLELHYRLPLLHARPRTLAHLFSQLEEQKQQLGVISYGMSSCTMEEIFMKLTEQELQESTEANVSDASAPRPSLQSVESQASLDVSLAEVSPSDGVFDEEGLLFGDTSCDDPLGSSGLKNSATLTGVRLWITQFYALFVKRVHYTKGKVVALVVQNLFPLLLITVSLLIAKHLQDVQDPPPLELSPQLFFAKADYNYFFAGGYYTNETAPMIDTLFRPCGVGASKLGSSRNETSKCYYNSSMLYPCSSYPKHQYSCSCQMCNDSDLYQSPPMCYNGTQSGSRVQNLTEPFDPQSPDVGYTSLHEYLLRSSDSFIEQRYGGVSFGHFKDSVPASVDELNFHPGSLPFLATHSAAKVWYSLKGYHAMPSYLNTMNNAILRSNLDSADDQSEFGITTVSHPFNITELKKSWYAITENASFLVNPLAAVFSLGFVVAGFVLLLIEERAGNIKHLQLVCGLNKAVYWLFTYVWDLLWFSAFIVLMLLLYLAFQDPFYTGHVEAPLFTLILVCYGLAATPWMYMLSFLFKSSATAYVLLFCLNFFSGFCFLLVDAILLYLGDNDDGNFLQYTLVWIPFPAYALGRSMMFLSLDRPLSLYIATFNLTSEPTPNPYLKLLPFIGSLLIQSCLYTGVVVIIEAFPHISKMCLCRYRQVWSLPAVPPNEDEAVAKERRRVLRGDHQGDLLVLNNLTKVYGGCGSSQPRLAVNQLCLRMQKAECFGLLGVNGAGKTTTFRMLTGDTHITQGKATIASHHMGSGSPATQRTIGYCPQVDALIDPLTGRQHLTFYCRLRGLPASQVQRVVEWALSKLDLEEHADKPVMAYSGGNKRKLSTAIALLARPSLILLDEPTSGVDPRSRRFLWTVVKGLVSAGQSVLLTTHSMAECEALCSRVGIMVNGTLRCLGTPQQLKSTYGQGYRLKIRTTGQTEPLKEFIRQNLTTSTLKEEHYNTILYQLPSVGLCLPRVYDVMEAARESLDIEDYSLSQTTLDDVFIHFANEQNEEVGLQHIRSSNKQQASSSSGKKSLQLPDIVSDIETEV